MTKGQQIQIGNMLHEITHLRQRLAAAENALQRLMDVQNGPPLIRDKQEWNEAMAEACGVLKNANAMQFYLTGADEAKGGGA